MKDKILVSIIIPTKNSAKYLEILLQSCSIQSYQFFETIVVDNLSSDDTKKIASKYNVKFIKCDGKLPQVAKQRNIGAKKALGEYLYFMDHDMELSKEFMFNFAKEVVSDNFIDAWYIPEHIISHSKILSIARNFESEFVNGTPISSARVIRKNIFIKTDGFDNNLSGGPSDWDLNNQLIKLGANIRVFSQALNHHEENLSFKTYLAKKSKYIKNSQKYKKKWKNLDRNIYENVVKKQFSIYYRFLGIFIQNGNWKRLLVKFDQYLVFLVVKFMLGIIYVANLKINRYEK